MHSKRMLTTIPAQGHPRVSPDSQDLTEAFQPTPAEDGFGRSLCKASAPQVDRNCEASPYPH
jgi:hypothetical protein